VSVSTARVRAFRNSVIALTAVVLLLSVAGQPIALGAIHGYQRLLAPAAARIGWRCRFTPTCSRYAEAVITRDGVVRGGWKTLNRIARCGPWTAMGTIDRP
jgi:putative membrane protein insertion efficiency factor